MKSHEVICQKITEFARLRGTSIPCKLLEHVIYTNVINHLEKQGYLNDKQHGFRSSRSCESQLALTVNDLAKILDDKGQVNIIIMDFCKAFDTVPHEILLAKIRMNYNSPAWM